ncbi:MAG: hypothetical protein V1889_00925 [archaeon]
MPKLIPGLVVISLVMACLALYFAIADAPSLNSTGRVGRGGVVAEVNVKVRYIIEGCVVRGIEGKFLANVYTHSEIGGGKFLFFLTNVNEECAKKLETAKVGEDFIIFDDVRPVEREGVEKRGGMEYAIFKTDQPFHCVTVKVRRVEEKPSGGTIASNEE